MIHCTAHPDREAVMGIGKTNLCAQCEKDRHYFDRVPSYAITPAQVRLNRELTVDACQHGGAICCDAKRLRWVLEELQKHPGVSSTAREVVEAALEPWPASQTT